MKNCIYLLSIFALLVSAPSISSGQMQVSGFGGGFGGDNTASSDVNDVNSLLSESKLGLWLVRAECASVSAGQAPTGQWSISAVFNGPQTMKGTQFFVQHRPMGFSSGNYPTFYPFRGQSALWVVQLRQQKVTIAPFPLIPTPNNTARQAYGSYFPIEQNKDGSKNRRVTRFSNFNQALAYAQSIARVAKADRNEQIRLLGVYAKSPMPQRSAWAISTLAQSGLEEAPRFLLGLVGNPKISISGLLSLDQGLDALDAQDKVQWSDTANRVRLWRRLVTSPASEEDGIAVVNGLLSINLDQTRAKERAGRQKQTFSPPVDGVRLFEWLRLATSNAKWAVGARGYAAAGVGGLAGSGSIARASAWAFLLRLVCAHPDFSPGKRLSATTRGTSARLAEDALSGLRSLHPLTASEKAALTALSPRAKSSRFKAILDALLQPSR